MTEEINTLQMMTAQALKRYKVEVLLEKMESYTVWAHDPQEAQELVQRGQGRAAGSVGPNVAGINIDEMGEGSEENAAILDNAETELDPAVKPLVEVVNQ